MRIGMAVEALAEFGEISMLVVSQRMLAITEGVPDKYRQLCEGRVWQLKDTDPHPVSVLNEISQPSPKLLASWNHAWTEAPELRDFPSDFDVVWVFRLRMWPVLQQLKKKGVRAAKEVLDIDDVESVATFRHAMLLKGAMGRVGFLLALWEAAKLWVVERRASRRFDTVLVCSEIGKQEMSLAGKSSKIKILPNGIRRPAPAQDGPATASEGKGQLPTVLFVGSLDFYPNVGGLMWMSAEVLPLLKQAFPQPFRTVVVGRNPDPRLRKLAQDGAFELHADVPDVAAYYAQATVVVAPIWAGSGTRIKILEAFAFGVPVVSTTLGAEGLGTVDGQHALIADTPSEFADKIAALLGNPAQRQQLARNADTLLEEHFTPDAIRRQVGRILDSGS